ncbi:MAG: prepilin peptidase [Bacilli bacterium]
MEFSIILGLFIMGAFLGSFYNVVAYRLPKGESIVYPSSHCPNCNHKLSPWELIPIFSFLIQGGKCTKCKKKISWFYPIAEILCGLLFVLAYLSFGISLDLIIALTFISLLIIVILSDYYYMIIEDSVLIVFGLLLMMEIFFIHGFNALVSSIISGVIAFAIMYLLKLFGDFLFKKESLGGGDIKLMFIFGLVIGSYMAIISIFLAAFIALPISLIILKLKKNHEIPFGPFLSVGALIIFLTHIDINTILNLLR